MNVLYIRYALEVARYGSLNKAAEKLFMAQPNLSRAIKELEKDTGVIIFERNTKGMTLTPDGEKLLSYGKRILEQIDEMENMFRGGEEKKTFSISVPRASYISYAFSRFSREIGEGRAEIFYKETNALRAINNILHSGYKMGIIRYARRHDRYFSDMLDEKGLEGILVTEFNYVLTMSKNHPLAEKKEVLFDDLPPYIEIAHADPFVPSLPFAQVRKEELPDNIDRRIYVYERASQFELMSSNPQTFMWTSPAPTDLLDRYGLIQKKSKDNTKVYRDVLVFPKGYRMTALDRLFVDKLQEAKHEFIK